MNINENVIYQKISNTAIAEKINRFTHAHKLKKHKIKKNSTKGLRKRVTKWTKNTEEKNGHKIELINLRSNKNIILGVE